MERPFQDLALSIPTLKDIPWFFLSSQPLFHGNQRNSTTLKLERQLSKSWSESSIGTLLSPGIQVRPERGRQGAPSSHWTSIRAHQEENGECLSPPCVFLLNSYKFNKPEKKVSHKGGKTFCCRLDKRWNALTLSHQHLRQRKRKKPSTIMAADFWELVWQSGRIW